MPTDPVSDPLRRTLYMGGRVGGAAVGVDRRRTRTPMTTLGLVAVLAAVAGCATGARESATRSSVGAAPPREAAVLRSVAVTPRCKPSVTTAARSRLTAVDEVSLARRDAVCGAASPADVCACLAKDLAALGTDFDHGPGTCELAKASSMSAQVATVFSTESRDGEVAAVSTVVIARDAAGWAAYGVVELVAEIDLTETPRMSAAVEVTAVSEAVFGAARFAWIETATTEEDVAGAERYIDAMSALTICELGERVRCGRVDLATWQYVVAHAGDDGEVEEAEGEAEADDADAADVDVVEEDDEVVGFGDDCRSAAGASRRAEQRDANGLMLVDVGGNDSRRVRFVRP